MSSAERPLVVVVVGGGGVGVVDSKSSASAGTHWLSLDPLEPQQQPQAVEFKFLNASDR